MPSLSDWASYYLEYHQDLVNGIRQIRKGFVSHTSGYWLFWVCFISSLLLVIGFAFWLRYKSGKTALKEVLDDPDLLFWNLLNQVQLPESDKMLLHEMTTDARLTQPASALLSPQSLDWACHLWIQEKGSAAIPPEKLRRINEISVFLYDHYPSPTEPEPVQTD